MASSNRPFDQPSRTATNDNVEAPHPARMERAYRGALRVAQMGRRSQCRDVELMILAEMYVHQVNKVNYDGASPLQSWNLDTDSIEQAQTRLHAKGMIAIKQHRSESWWRIPDAQINTISDIFCRLADGPD